MQPLCEPLHDALTSANGTARERHPEFDGREDLAPVLTHIARGLALVHLREVDLGGWKLRRQNNAGIELRRDAATLRVLHQLPDRAAPPPGRNLARRTFYYNATLSEDMLPPKDNLLAIWSASQKGAVTIRVVRPVGPWRYGRTEQVDLNFVLPQSPTDLQNLVFEPSDADITIEIPREDAGGAEHGVGG